MEFLQAALFRWPFEVQNRFHLVYFQTGPVHVEYPRSRGHGLELSGPGVETGDHDLRGREPSRTRESCHTAIRRCSFPWAVTGIHSVMLAPAAGLNRGSYYPAWPCSGLTFRLVP